jgi:hypothetical protein
MHTTRISFDWQARHEIHYRISPPLSVIARSREGVSRSRVYSAEALEDAAGEGEGDCSFLFLRWRDGEMTLILDQYDMIMGDERWEISRQVLGIEGDESPSSSSSIIHHHRPASQEAKMAWTSGLRSTSTTKYCEPNEATMIVELRVKIEMNVRVCTVLCSYIMHHICMYIQYDDTRSAGLDLIFLTLPAHFTFEQVRYLYLCLDTYTHILILIYLYLYTYIPSNRVKLIAQSPQWSFVSCALLHCFTTPYISTTPDIYIT